MSANSNNRRKGPIRQFSLHNTPETPTRRKGLKKQFSEDIPDSKEKWIPELGFHVSLCTKNQIKTLDRPPPAKLAWIESHHQEPEHPHMNKNEEGIIAKKCKEIKRPVTAKITRQSSLNNKDSILLSHQELAERLRQAWKDREKGKQNLNIFLAHNVKDKPDEEFSNDLTDSEGAFSNDNAFDKTVNKPKIILPLKPELATGNEINYKNIFQKRMRRAHSIEEPLIKDIAYSPTRTLETKSRTVVVVPLVENAKPKEIKETFTSMKYDTDNKEKIPPLKVKEEEKIIKPAIPEVIHEEEKPIDVIIRPMTAASKREGFRSRTNSAFHGSSTSTKENQRPPLVRASSVPLKPSPPKPKFLSVKRRVKSAPKKKERIEKEAHEIPEEYYGEEDEERSEDKEDGKNKGKKFQRSVSVSGTEIITMVSLVSPEESENEEQVEAEKEKAKVKAGSPVKTTTTVEKPVEKPEHQKSFTLRKAVKSVSFQQSSIHAVRSFSASFPARRGSVATALMLNNSLGKTSCSSTQEKRGTVENVSNDDVREPKRRLVRTKSAPSERSADEEKEDENASSSTNSKSMEKSKSQNKHQQPKSVHNTPENNDNKKSAEAKDASNENSTQEENPDAEPEFDTPKEKQCWEMYCKMSEKGVSISFDTILRGMLTPTEYRLRRKPSITNADNNAENNAENNASADNATDS